MKVLVISDVHANIDALQAVEQAEGYFDLTLFIGDMMDWGMFPHETIQWFRNHPHVAVSGNHDRELLALWDRGTREPLGEETNYLSRCINQLTEEDIAYLRALPLDATVTLDGFTYYLKHAYDEEQFPEAVLDAMCRWESQPLFERIWAAKVGDHSQENNRRIIFGHSHQCWMHMVRNGCLFLNPGSVCYRLGADTMEFGCDYMVITDGVPAMKHTDYCNTRTQELLKDCKFLPHFMDLAQTLAWPHSH